MHCLDCSCLIFTRQIRRSTAAASDLMCSPAAQNLCGCSVAGASRWQRTSGGGGGGGGDASSVDDGAGSSGDEGWGGGAGGGGQGGDDGDHSRRWQRANGAGALRTHESEQEWPVTAEV